MTEEKVSKEAEGITPQVLLKIMMVKSQQKPPSCRRITMRMKWRNNHL
jgi:hypothetical protein